MVDTTSEATEARDTAAEARFREQVAPLEAALIAGDLDAAEEASRRIIQGSGFGSLGDFYHGYGFEHLGVCMLLRAETASTENITPGEKWSDQDWHFQEATKYFDKAGGLYAKSGAHARRAATMRYAGVVYARWGEPGAEDLEDLFESIEYLERHAGKIEGPALDEHLAMSLACLAECLAERDWGRDKVLARGYLRTALELPQRNPYYVTETSRIAAALGVEAV